MRPKMRLAGLAWASVIATSVVTSVVAHGPGSQGSDQGMSPMMGQGMMGQGMMGQGMMGQHHKGQMPMMESDMMGQLSIAGGYGCGQMQPLRRDLTIDEVKHMMQHRIDWAENTNLKLGITTEESADTIVTEIVTKDGSLVRRIEVNRHTGRMQAVQ